MNKALHLLAISAVMALCVEIASAATPAEVKAAIESQFTITTRSMMGGIKAPGTVLVVQKEGLRAGKPTAFIRPAIINNGQLTSVGGGGAILGGNSGAMLKVGDRVYLYRLTTSEKNVIIFVGTIDTFQVTQGGNSTSVPNEAAIQYQYDGGLTGATTDAVLSDIGAWFKTEGESANVATKTISLGQTPEQVVAIMGAPEKKIELGPKVIYTYKDLKVIFVGGKVSDVQ